MLLERQPQILDLNSAGVSSGRGARCPAVLKRTNWRRGDHTSLAGGSADWQAATPRDVFGLSGGARRFSAAAQIFCFNSRFTRLRADLERALDLSPCLQPSGSRVGLSSPLTLMLR